MATIELSSKIMKRAAIIFGIVLVMELVFNFFFPSSTVSVIRSIAFITIISWIGLAIWMKLRRRWFWTYTLGIIIITILSIFLL